MERWSARKWTARILISWGVMTVLCGFIHTATQFYLVRFLVGVSEASFFPGMIVCLTHWFRQADRGRAVAIFITAIPASLLIGAPLAGWMLSIGWHGLAGWRWLFILEGIPAVAFGVVTLFYLTDRPEVARWLPQDEKDWIMAELAAEKRAKHETAHFTIWQACADRRVLLVTAVYFLATIGMVSAVFWMPTFIKRLSGFSNAQVSLLVMLPAFAGLAGVIFNGWHSDKTGERRWHTAIPLFGAAVSYFLLVLVGQDIRAVMALFTVAGACIYAYFPAIWAISTTFLRESAAAAAYGLIVGVGQAGGLFGPSIIGYLSDRTHNFLLGFCFIGCCFLLASLLILKVNVGVPASTYGPMQALVPGAILLEEQP